MDNLSKIFIFAANIRVVEPVMLGIKTRRTPVGGDVANQIRDAVTRVATGQLNERDLASVKRSKEALSRYDIHWEL